MITGSGVEHDGDADGCKRNLINELGGDADAEGVGVAEDAVASPCLAQRPTIEAEETLCPPSPEKDEA